VPTFGNIRLAHELDIAWLIALWIQIHDGDPSPIEVNIDARTAVLADEFISHLTRVVKDQKEVNSVQALEERFAVMGLPVAIHESTTGQEVAEELILRPGTSSGVEEPGCCVRMGGRLVCIHLKAVKRN
jgi:hypothetical protein